MSRTSRSPSQPCRAPAGSWVGAKRASSRKRLPARLTRFDPASPLTTSPSAASPTASTVPTSRPSNNAGTTTETPRPSTQTYGTATRKAANHSESAASSLPTAIWLRGAGVSSRVSSVARSRSPLIPSAPSTIVTSTPTDTATCSERFTASRCSR